MKHFLIILSIVFVPEIIFSNSSEINKYGPLAHDDVIVLEVTHRKNRNGLYTEIRVNTGDQYPSDISELLQNAEDGMVRIKRGDEIILTSNEADVLNFLADQGYEIVSTYVLTADSQDITKYVLAR